MKYSLIITIFIAAIVLKADNIIFRYKTIFPNNGIPIKGIAEEKNRLAPLIISPSVAISPYGTLLFDGKSSFVTIPDSSLISLRNGATFTMIVKFYDKSPSALFYRHNELLIGRNTLKQFYCNISEAKIGSPGIKTGQYQHLAVALSPVKNNKINISIYVNGKLVNRPKLLTIKPQNSPKKNLEFGHAPNRGSAWYFKGELAEISLHNKNLSLAEIALDVNRFINKTILKENLHGSIGKGKLYGKSIKAAGNRKSKPNKAIILTNSQVEWQSNIKENFFAEVMFKSLNKPTHNVQFMRLNFTSSSYLVELPKNSSQITLKNNKLGKKITFPSGNLQNQSWMSNDAMWHYLTIVKENDTLLLGFDGFFAKEKISAKLGNLQSISLGGNGCTVFSDFQITQGTLNKDELRSRYLNFYQFDDGRTGLLNISQKLEKIISAKP